MQYTCGPLLSNAGVVERGSKAWGSPPSQPKVPLWLDHRQRGTLFYTESPNAKKTTTLKYTKEKTHICNENLSSFFLSCHINSTQKENDPSQMEAFFFLVLLLKHSLAITLNPLSVSLDHGGCTCSSCDSNEEMALQQNSSLSRTLISQ